MAAGDRYHERSGGGGGTGAGSAAQQADPADPVGLLQRGVQPRPSAGPRNIVWRARMSAREARSERSHKFTSAIAAGALAFCLLPATVAYAASGHQHGAGQGGRADVATQPVDGTGAAISLDQTPAQAATSMNCTLAVPADPHSAKGLATPYQLGDGCSEATQDEQAFVVSIHGVS